MTAVAQPHHRRADVQGLRGIAVLLVIAFHAFGWPRGGFVGVDVFFVISGYVITTGLLREITNTGMVSLRGFYLRRVRRIAPAALVCLTAVSIAAFLLPPVRTVQVQIDAVWAAFGAENWRAMTSGLDPHSIGDLSPVGHFWSLAVEEQFYLFWPLLLGGAVMAGHRFRVVAFAVAATLTGGSLALGAWMTAAGVGWAYGSTFSRVWELGFGVLLAIASERLAQLPAAVRAVLGGCGAVAIAAAALLLVSDGFMYPVPGGLLPTIGAGALIAAGVGGQPFTSTLLAIRPLQKVGELSYSLYLWHFPAIVFVATLEVRAGMAGVLIAVVIGVAAAWLSYRFVEQPALRFRAAAPTRFRPAASPVS